MLSVFPNFRAISSDDQDSMNQILKKFPPYSDFNFVSLYSWNISNTTEICTLNNNLIIKLKDYTSENMNYSFLGSEKAIETIQALFESLKEQNIALFNFVPEPVINSDSNIYSKFNISELPDHGDYILDIEKISEMSGGEFHKKRNLYKRFERDNLVFLKIFDDLGDDFSKAAEVLFLEWANLKQKQKSDYQDELAAFKNCCSLSNLNLKALCLFIDDKLVGFTICEIIDSNYSMIHFEKTNPSFTGITEYLMRESAKFLKSQKIKYINYQQDLGIPGLKYSKTSYHPLFFLKKYSIQKKSAN